jgi:two-component system sensor histidine kinase/response regulator
MKRILVIDDEEWLREMIRLVLNQRGYDVIEAGNGKDGIASARRDLPDLILCDVNMDRAGAGYTTLSTLRSEVATASIPFILMTGLADASGMRHGMELGADDYLPKPFKTEELFAAVETRLKKAQTIRDEAERKLANLRDNLSFMLPHEMRTPLNGIISNAEILASCAETLRPEEIVEMGNEIQSSSQRLERLIENFLIYAQLELIASDPKHGNLLGTGQVNETAMLIEKVATTQAGAAKRGSDLRLDVKDFSVRMSEQYFTKVVSELVQNAFKFSNMGSAVHISFSQENEQSIFTVKDRGHGFSPEQLNRIGAYMQFERKMKDQQGLGLGLAIARRLVELHGGTLGIESEKECGTTVTVKLPKIKINGHALNGHALN